MAAEVIFMVIWWLISNTLSCSTSWLWLIKMLVVLVILTIRLMLVLNTLNQIVFLSFKKLIMSEYELTSFEKEFTPFKNLRLNAILTSSQPTSHFFPLHALFFLTPLSIKLDLYRAPWTSQYFRSKQGFETDT